MNFPPLFKKYKNVLCFLCIFAKNECMTKDEKYMHRCLQLAALGLGKVQPNPMVGAVIVCDDKIVGEGYHHQYGGPHAEVNAINSLMDKTICKQSTIYVTLEPCAHHGKTPPCADKLVEMGFPRVVIGATDPHDKVNGKGIAKLHAAGIDVTTGVLQSECEWQNRRFFTFHTKKRPYIILKWAQTADGYMDIVRPSSQTQYWITNDELRVIVHKWRSEEQAILIGYNTYLNDRPQLTTRLYPGKNPVKYLMMRHPESFENDEYRLLPDDLSEAMAQLYADGIQSVIVEGGRKTLELFLSNDLWDEARVLTGKPVWGRGVPAPIIGTNAKKELLVSTDKISWFYRP